MTDPTFHLTAERIQALLDGQLPEGDAARAREHVDGCARCRSQVEAWRDLFAGLEELPGLAPTAGFADRVLASLPPPPAALPWAARVRGWLGLGSPVPAGGHPAPARLHDLLDGRLAGRKAAAVETHLRSCHACRHEMEGLARVVSSLEQLPRHAPSEGFGERVMAAVRVPEPASALARLRTLAVARMREVLSLRTRRAWAAVAGVAFTPAVMAAVVAWAVFSHPLVTVGNLASFLWLQGSDMVAGAVAWAAASAVEVPMLLGPLSALRDASVGPATAAAGFVAFSGLTLLAVWVLYSNLIAADAAEGRYAKP